MRKIKLFEKFIGEGEDIQELDDVFNDLDLDHDVEILCFPRNDISKELSPEKGLFTRKVFTVSLTFESRIGIKDLLGEIENRISMAGKMGFGTYTGFYLVPKGKFWGIIEYQNLPSHPEVTRYSKLKINDDIFVDDKILDDIGGLYSKKIYWHLNPYERFDKNYKIHSIVIHFEKLD
jgi:hypothetical protein